MKLTYRGVSYDYSPATLEMTEGEIWGKYRGQAIRRHQLARTVERPDVESVLLHYRGGFYPSLQPTLPETMSHTQEAAAASCPVQLSHLTTLMSPDVRQVHLDNMRASLERRIQSAREKGDEQLVSLLQQESNHLRLSH